MMAKHQDLGFLGDVRAKVGVGGYEENGEEMRGRSAKALTIALGG
jgi:hypothetical protein